jgi:putative DNA primase/helicase
MTTPLSKEQIKAKADRAEARSRGDGAAKELVEIALTEGELDVEIRKLAELPPGVYESRRVEAAKWLGMRAGALDKLVYAGRSSSKPTKEAPPLYPHWIVTPCSEPVEADALLRDIIRCAHRYAVCSHHDALASALWVMLSWIHGVATFSPLLVITSAEPMSGKTTLLRVISFLCPRSISTVEISEAALYRAIELYQPTFVIDEFDSVLANPEKGILRSVINSGHTRGDGILRVNKDKQFALEHFSTFCPKAIGMIGRKLPPATLTRCIFIEMQRRKRDEKVERFKHVDNSELADLRSRLCRWAMDSANTLRDADPAMPGDFENRYGDNWRMQFAIADLAGEDWGEEARAAASEIEHASDNATGSARLLKAVKTILDEAENGDGAIGSQQLIDKLIADQTSEWAEWRHGKPISQRQLAALLKPFRIFPEQVRIGGQQVRGYQRERFNQAWDRYV